MWRFYSPALIISFLPMYTIFQKIIYIVCSILALQAIFNPNFRSKLIVYRSDLSGKLWHRLKNVLVYGTSIALICYFGYQFFTDSWVEYNYPAYSFEPNYNSTKGKVIDCKFTADNDDPAFFVNPKIDCGEHNLDFKSFSPIEPFLKRFFSVQGLYKEYVQHKNQLSLQARGRGGLLLYESGADAEILNDLINKGLVNNIKVKETKTILYASIVDYIIMSFLLIVGWFFFWEAVIYRAIIYIVYGKAKRI